MIRCPECELEDPEIVRLTVLTVLEKQPLDVVLIDDYAFERESGEPETETLEADRDGAELRCEGCGYLTPDPDDFLAEDDPDEDEELLA